MQRVLKKCTKCKAHKTIEEFSKAKSTKDGLNLWCKSCMKVVSREYRKNHKEKCAENRRQWRLKNPDKYRLQWQRNYKANTDKRRAQNKEHRKNNPDRVFNNYLVRRFGVTLQEYNKMLNKQNGTCALCLSTGNSRRLAVDHCHSTNTIRGLLCTRHNMALGLFEDNIDVLLKAVNYLGRYK